MWHTAIWGLPFFFTSALLGLMSFTCPPTSINLLFIPLYFIPLRFIPPSTLFFSAELRCSIQFPHLYLSLLLPHIKRWEEIKNLSFLCPVHAGLFSPHFSLQVASETMTFWGNTTVSLSLSFLESYDLFKSLWTPSNPEWQVALLHHAIAKNIVGELWHVYIFMKR